MMKPKEEFHILIVDDMVDARDTAKEYLEHLGYTKFTIATDGSEAIAALESDPSIDLILADWDMPIMSGISLLQRIRSTAKWENLPFIMMTAPKAIEHEKVELAIEQMVSDYIVKPYRLQTLKDKMEKVTALSIHGPQKTIVVADDQQDALDMVVEYLQRFGFKKIKTFMDGDSALAYVKQNSADVGLIIADWEMPKMKGVEMLSACKADFQLKDIPFFIITSQVSMERMKVTLAAQQQVDQYLLKPFTKEKLQSRVEESIARAKVAKEVNALVAEGFEALEHARTKAAQACFTQAMMLDPAYDLSLSGFGDLYRDAKGPAAAIPYYHRALTMNPMRESHYVKLAKCYLELKQYGKAIHVLQAGQTHLKSNARFGLMLSEIYTEKRMYRKAYDELKAVLDHFPDHDEAAHALIVIKKELDEKGDGESEA